MAPESTESTVVRPRLAGGAGGPGVNPDVRRFVWAQPLVLVYCVAQCLLYSFLGIVFTECYTAAMVCVLGHILLLSFRILAGCMADQARARELFSRFWVAAYVLNNSALWGMNRRSQLVAGLPSEGMFCVHVLVMLEGMYMKVLGLHSWARLGTAACNVLLFALLPAPWSDLGQPWEAVGAACAHAAGELFLPTLSLHKTFMIVTPPDDLPRRGAKPEHRRD